MGPSSLSTSIPEKRLGLLLVQRVAEQLDWTRVKLGELAQIKLVERKGDGRKRALSAPALHHPPPPGPSYPPNREVKQVGFQGRNSLLLVRRKKLRARHSVRWEVSRRELRRTDRPPRANKCPPPECVLSSLSSESTWSAP